MINSLVRRKSGGCGETYPIFSPILNKLLPDHHNPTTILRSMDIILFTLICNSEGKARIGVTFAIH